MIVYIYIYMYVCMCVSLSLSLCVCIYIYIYVHIYVYIYIYIHIFNRRIPEPAGTGRGTEPNRTEPRRVRKTQAEARRTGNIDCPNRTEPDQTEYLLKSPEPVSCQVLQATLKHCLHFSTCSRYSQAEAVLIFSASLQV